MLREIGEFPKTERWRQRSLHMTAMLYRLDRGQTQFEVVAESGTLNPGYPDLPAQMNFTIALDAGLTRTEVLNALDAFKNHILQGPLPPA
jgi:hypothetical protein